MFKLKMCTLVILMPLLVAGNVVRVPLSANCVLQVKICLTTCLNINKLTLQMLGKYSDQNGTNACKACKAGTIAANDGSSLGLDCPLV